MIRILLFPRASFNISRSSSWDAAYCTVIYYRVGLRAVWEFSQFLETSSLFDLPQDSSSIHDIDNDLRHIPVILATLWTHQEVMTGDKPIVRPGVNSKYSNAQSFQLWAESVKFDNNTIIMWRIRNMPILLGPLQARRYYGYYTNNLITLYTLNAAWASPRLNHNNHPHLGQSPNWDDVRASSAFSKKNTSTHEMVRGVRIVVHVCQFCCSAADPGCSTIVPNRVHQYLQRLTRI